MTPPWLVDQIGVGTTVPLSSPIDILVGPLTPMGTSAYDVIHAQRVAQVRDEYPEVTPITPYSDVTASANLIGDVFYDLVLTLYMAYYRTRDDSYLTKARQVAVDQYQTALFANIGPYLDGNFSLQVANALNYVPIGATVHYFDTGDTNSRDMVSAMAASGARQGPYDRVAQGNYTRVSAFYLMAQVCSMLMGVTSAHGYDISAGAAANLEAFLASPGPETSGQLAGAWSDIAGNPDPNGITSSSHYVEHFMDGLVMEALILYDRAYGDSRIIPALINCCTYMWGKWVQYGGGPQQNSVSSSTSVAIGTGLKTFTTTAGKNWPVGMPIRASSATDGTYLAGPVNSYSGTTLVINVTGIFPYATHGTGSRTDWTIEADAYPGDSTANGNGCLPYAGFTDSRGADGTIHTRSNENYLVLEAMIYPAFGYLYSRRQGATYKACGDTMLAGFVARNTAAVYPDPLKQVDQGLHFSPRYLGWIA